MLVYMLNDLISQSKCTQTDLITQQELAAADLVCIFFEVFILVLQNFGNINKQINRARKCVFLAKWGC